MKTRTALALSFVAGAALSAGIFFVWFRQTSDGAKSDQQSKLQASGSRRPVAPADRDSTANPADPENAPHDQPLEASLREIREAGMVVIPQEFLRFYTPILFAGEINKTMVEVLRLDDREITMMTSTRFHFEQRLTSEAEKNLTVTETGKDFITAKIPAFPELRRQLIASMRNDILTALDPESATLFSYLDWEKALSSLPEGRESTLRIRQVEGDEKLHVTLTLAGTTRVVSMSREEVMRLYPSLKDRLPIPLNP